MNYVNYRIVSGILLGMILFFGSCGVGTEKSTEGSEGDAVALSLLNPALGGSELGAPEVRVYAFGPGGLVSLTHTSFEDELRALKQPFIPWVNQLRISDFLLFGDSLYFTVNGFGFGRIRPGESFPAVDPLLKDDYFQNRTLGSSRIFDESILCQFYGDRVFSEESIVGRPPLISFFPDGEEGKLSSHEHNLPIGADSPGELVEFSVRQEGWFLSWKENNPDGVSFSYQICNPEDNELVFLDADEYRQALFPSSLSEAPERVQVLCRRAFEGRPYEEIEFESEGPVAEPVSIVRWSFSNSRPAEKWYEGDLSQLINGEADLSIVYGFSDSRTLYLLDPSSGYVWYTGVLGETPPALLLPELPSGCVYTGLAVFDGTLFLSWEEQSFPSVGAAGLMMQAL